MLANALWLFGAAKARTSHAGFARAILGTRHSACSRSAHNCRHLWRIGAVLSGTAQPVKTRARGLATAMAAALNKRAIVEIISDVV